MTESWIRKAAEWLGGHEKVVLVSLATIILGLWVFAELADEVMDGDTQSFDEAVVRAMRESDDPQQPVGPPWLKQVARDITALGGWAVLILVTFAVAGFLRLSGRIAMMASVLLASVGGMLVGFAVKALITRPRPSIVPHLTEVSSWSFPSGHSMMSAAIYLTLGTLLTTVIQERYQRFYIFFLAVSVTILVGLSRIYLGVHYPTDVLAGWTLGLVWAVFCRMVLRYVQKETPLMDDETPDQE